MSREQDKPEPLVRALHAYEQRAIRSTRGRVLNHNTCMADAVAALSHPQAASSTQAGDINYFYACDVAAEYGFDHNQFSAALRTYLKGPAASSTQAAGSTGLGEVVAFLLGEAPLEGYWFGDTEHLPRYWWRSRLRHAVGKAALAAQEGAQGERADNGDPDTIVPAPSQRKQRPA